MPERAAAGGVDSSTGGEADFRVHGGESAGVGLAVAFSSDRVDFFASRLAPTGDCISNVGASLLAKGTPTISVRNRQAQALFHLFHDDIALRFTHMR
ncbi:hypothetical protein PspCFBP13508_10570 [Pseudomonas sp. CFBP13508]|nr:hypothetical protein PspCFBP13508_10570 [Pseudomonas sp. CFBP13508]